MGLTCCQTVKQKAPEDSRFPVPTVRNTYYVWYSSDSKDTQSLGVTLLSLLPQAISVVRFFCISVVHSHTFYCPFQKPEKNFLGLLSSEPKSCDSKQVNKSLKNGKSCIIWQQ